jgi:hypothetical protein
MQVEKSPLHSHDARLEDSVHIYQSSNGFVVFKSVHVFLGSGSGQRPPLVGTTLTPGIQCACRYPEPNFSAGPLKYELRRCRRKPNGRSYYVTDALLSAAATEFALKRHVHIRSY